MRLLYVFMITTLALEMGQSARILGVFNLPSYSHQVVYQEVWKELALQGHNMVIITPNPIKDMAMPNLRQIDWSSSYEIFRQLNFSVNEQRRETPKESYTALSSMMCLVEEHQLDHPEVQELIANENEHFDLVLAEWYTPMPGAFAVRFKAPLVGITSMSPTLFGHLTMRNPAHPITNPDVFLPFTDNLSFWERLQSFNYLVWQRYYAITTVIPKQMANIKKHFGEVTIYDIVKQLSILIVNSNKALYPPRPNVPGIIEVQHLHLQQFNELPEDIKTFLDTAKEGAIYFSLGSNVKSSLLPESKVKEILAAFAELPYKVLWKWESDHLVDKPENVMISKWFPQQELLGHPNVKLFIMQGGLQSIDEALFNAVPIIGIPIFADQPRNVKRLLDIGVAVKLELSELNKNSLKVAINEVISNNKYKNNMKELQQRARDEPMAPLEKALWWISYVLRHKGADHLHPSAIPLWQYFMLDILAFYAVIAAVMFFVLKRVKSLLVEIVYRQIKQKRS